MYKFELVNWRREVREPIVVFEFVHDPSFSELYISSTEVLVHLVVDSGLRGCWHQSPPTIAQSCRFYFRRLPRLINTKVRGNFDVMSFIAQRMLCQLQSLISARAKLRNQTQHSNLHSQKQYPNKINDTTSYKLRLYFMRNNLRYKTKTHLMINRTGIRNYLVT